MFRTACLCLALSALAGCGGKPAPTASTAATAQPVAAAQPASPVERYLAALAAVEAAKTPTSLEALLDAAEAAQGALMEVSGDTALLETYGEAEFTALQQRLRGLKLGRGSDIYAQPDPAFFLTLATAHGRPEDIAYFTLEAATWGADGVPVYLQLRAQPTPCVRFGEGRIAPLYERWKNFAAQHPEAYASRTRQQLADLEELVVLATCACGDLASVQREQADFLKAHPDAPQASAIRARAQQLLDEPEKLPIHCR